MFFKYLKNFIKFFFFFISFLFSLKNLVILLFKVNFKNKKIFLQHEGGFGWTIITPEILLRLNENKDWILIFGYNSRRHNYQTKNLYPSNFFWLNLSYDFRIYKVVSLFFSNLIFSILKIYLKINSIHYLDINKFLSGEKKYKFKNVKFFYKNNDYYSDHKSRVVFLAPTKQNFHKINIPRINNIILGNKKKCAILLRSRTSNDINSIKRNSDLDFISLTKILENIIEIGWEPIIYGDININDINAFQKLKKYLIYEKKYNLSQDDYNIFAALKADCFIGPFSGGVCWKYIFPKKPLLILDGHPFGHAIFNSLISYKIFVPKKKLITINQILNDNLYFYKDMINVRSTNYYEKNLIILNFLKNINNIKKEGYTYKDLKLKKNHPLGFAGARVSKTWLSFQNKMLN